MKTESELFCMDNLELMKELPDNSLDLIYCDILYGTGRKFKDYQDLKPKREIIEEHYIPRIKEMHRILKDTGSIYLQMDTRINHWIRCIMDDIFGYGNFLNEILWKRSSGSNKIKVKYSNTVDFILFYSKSSKYVFNQQIVELSKSSIKRYNKLDRFGLKYMLQNLQRKNMFKFEGDFRVFNGVKYYSKPSMGWNWTQETLDKKILDGIIVEISSDGKYLQKRDYLHNSKGKPVNSLWDDFSNITSTVGKYDTQKPKALLERIIKASSNEGDWVGDFYMGSGTTAEVCRDLNRNFIGCDINPKAIEITKKRLNIE